jgi:hypothetical protein
VVSFLRSPVSSMTSTAPVAHVLDEVGADVVADLVVIPSCPSEQVLHAVGAGVAGCLAIVQQFLPGRTGPRPGPAVRRVAPASGQGRRRLRCGLRLPSDLGLSSYHRIINGGRPPLCRATLGTDPRGCRSARAVMPQKGNPCSCTTPRSTGGLAGGVAGRNRPGRPGPGW